MEEKETNKKIVYTTAKSFITDNDILGVPLIIKTLQQEDVDYYNKYIEEKEKRTGLEERFKEECKMTR